MMATMEKRVRMRIDLNADMMAVYKRQAEAWRKKHLWDEVNRVTIDYVMSRQMRWTAPEANRVKPYAY